MNSSDDDIVAALHDSPGEPPSVDLHERVTMGMRRRRRRQSSFAVGGAAACVVAAAVIVPVLSSGGRSNPERPADSSVSAARCGESMPTEAPTDAVKGPGFVPGQPGAAAICEYAVDDGSDGTRSTLTRSVSLDSVELATLLADVHALSPSNSVASCPPPTVEDVVTFAYAGGSTISLQLGCSMVWQSENVHALLSDPLASDVQALLANEPTASATPTLRATPDDSPAATVASIPAATPVGAANDVVLELDDSQHFTIADLASGKVLHGLGLHTIPGGPSLIAADPSGGWVVSYTPDSSSQWNDASQRLAVVEVSGAVAPFGPTYPASTPISGLAVSPDGTRVAIALMQGTGFATPASIVVMPMPGKSGTTQSWAADDPDVNEFEQLSWAPDGKRLTYIAGSQTGAGIVADPSTLDTTRAGRAPTQSTWPGDFPACPASGAAWLGTSGRFAVVRDCAPVRHVRRS